MRGKSTDHEQVLATYHCRPQRRQPSLIYSSMSSFFDSLLSPESCTVDGSMGRNPLTGAIERIVENMDVFAMQTSSSAFAMPGEAYFPAQDDIIADQHSYPSDMHMAGGWPSELMAGMHPSSAMMMPADEMNAATYMDPHAHPNLMPYPYPMMPFMPHPMHMPMMMMPMHPEVEEQYLYQDSHAQAHMINNQQEQPAKESITEHVGDALYHGRGVSSEEMKELMAHFQSQQEADDPMVSRADYQASWQRTLDNLTTLRSSEDYHFMAENPYLSEYASILDTTTAVVADPKEREEAQNKLLEEGMQHYRAGNIRQAIQCFEACVKIESTSDAWNLLGTCHTENDHDKQAILCFQRSLDIDQYNISSLLALSICYVNELDSAKALESIRAWVEHNPLFHGLEVPMDEYSDGTLMDEVIQLVEAVSNQAPNERDVQVLLGVLYNVTMDYDRAQQSFQHALSLPEINQDSLSSTTYSIHNKIGATLANSNRSSESISWYVNALKQRPGYARGWLNLGIAYSNLQQYDEAVKAYLQSLSLSPQAEHIWGFLRVALTSLSRYDLIVHTTKRDLAALQTEFS
jgi:peroxin-5